MESEGARQAAINVAEGRKRAIVLESEGNKEQAVNQAAGEAEAILLRANATAQSIAQVAQAIASNSHGKDAVSLSVANNYVESFSQLAKQSTTLILPGSGAGSVAGAVAEAMGVFEALTAKNRENRGVVVEDKDNTRSDKA